MQSLRLIHSECGGNVVLDRTRKPTMSPTEGDGTDLYQGVKCQACGAPLGLLANIDEVTYAKH